MAVIVRPEPVLLDDHELVPANETAGASPRASLRARRQSRRRWDGVALYGSFAVGVLLTFCYSDDDPFITLRYAANLVHGDGLVFNTGQRVEGFTSPLHLLLVAGAYVLPFGHALLKVKLLSLLFGVLTLVASRRLFDGLDLPRWGRTTGLILVAGSWSLAVVSANGLETTVACWFTTLLVAGLLRGDGVRRTLFLGLCAAGLAAVRPEGIAVAFVLALVSIFVEPRTRAWWRRADWFAGAVAAEAAIEILRFAYYGQLLPNTYYAKRGQLITDIHSGLGYLAQLLPGVPLVICLFVLVLALVGVLSILTGPNRRRWYLLGAIAGQVAFIVESGGDWMIGDRFFAPVVPMAAALVTIGAVEIVAANRQRFSGNRSAARIVVSALIGVTLAATVVVPYLNWHDPVWNSRGGLDDASLVAAGGYGTYSSGLWSLGPSELRCVPSGSWVADSEIGFAGLHRLDLRFIDPRGLTSGQIARNAPASDKNWVGVTDYQWFLPTSVVGRQILSLRPDLVITFDFVGHPRNVVLGGAYRLKQRVSFRVHGNDKFEIRGVAVYERTDPSVPESVSRCGRVS